MAVLVVYPGLFRVPPQNRPRTQSAKLLCSLSAETLESAETLFDLPWPTATVWGAPSLNCLLNICSGNASAPIAIVIMALFSLNCQRSACPRPWMAHCLRDP